MEGFLCMQLWRPKGIQTLGCIPVQEKHWVHREEEEFESDSFDDVPGKTLFLSFKNKQAIYKGL